ncbi:hypothetical protein SmJEL517_g01389 [Synchytrium microbalum]|uniref:Uncharacterized protein n=1 Tax=Synchytrium microbalum TaxID=1806994 RepID=A0A507C559_9FUNG|nr:uncharacterized protein SmJEL517_g01389 [Synchytrium microbalum]TPX36690.1 hypothetical protein SmJEL517_g01389 [Synchytrium microbalum]
MSIEDSEHVEADTPSPTCDMPELSSSDIHQCRFSSWYPIFASQTIKSKIIPLPAEFVAYLHADGVFLPLDQNGLPQPSRYSDADDRDIDEDDDETASELEEDEQDLPSFPDLRASITEAIKELGGAVFPKLNWSSPKDAAWITTTGTLKCVDPSDIFLLLKSSDFIVHDLDHAFDDVLPPKDGTEGGDEIHSFDLVLRRWYEYAPSMEFRCFVFDGRLLGISQRDNNYYEFLRPMHDDILSAVQKFISLSVSKKFPVATYVVDVYLYRTNLKVSIIDFNPFRYATDALLFSWSEIMDLAKNATSDNKPILRFVQPGDAMEGGFKYMTSRIPRDVVELSQGRTMQEFMAEFEDLMSSQLEEAR